MIYSDQSERQFQTSVIKFHRELNQMGLTDRNILKVEDKLKMQRVV